MSIIKNEIPILEFDSDKTAVIMPNHQNLVDVLPERAVFAFLGEHIHEYARKHNSKILTEFPSITRDFPIYGLNINGEEVCLVQAPVGGALAVSILDWLNGYGVKKAVSAGSCGALEHFDENVFLVPTRALRDEGTSYHYKAPTRFIDVNKDALIAIEKAIKKHGFEYVEVTTWSTDGFFRETKEKVAHRKEEGCAVVEMECAALAACAEMREMVWGEILYTADTLADPENYDGRDFGKASIDKALEICFDAVMEL